jgi:hypothetical protein
MQDADREPRRNPDTPVREGLQDSPGGEVSDLKYLAMDDHRYMTTKDMLAWEDKYRRGVNHDYRRLAYELGHLNKQFRGISERDLEELMRAIEHIEGGPRPPRVPGYNYEDLYHQAMGVLDRLMEDDPAEDDAVELLNQWQKILTQSESL